MLRGETYIVFIRKLADLDAWLVLKQAYSDPA
jgi:hypothetical protein